MPQALKMTGQEACPTIAVVIRKRTSEMVYLAKLEGENNMKPLPIWVKRVVVCRRRVSNYFALTVAFERCF